MRRPSLPQSRLSAGTIGCELPRLLRNGLEMKRRNAKTTALLRARHRIVVRPLPLWLDIDRLLGPGPWQLTALADGALAADAELSATDAADLCARLRGVGLAGTLLSASVVPPLPRAAIRAGRLAEARRMRDRGVGFERPATRVDAEAKWSLTPESLALALGERAAPRSVFDAGCGAGGNAIGFARAGCKVTAVDSDRERLQLARHNAAVYGVDRRIQFAHGDAEQWAPRVQADLLFVDPPWGRDYDKRQVTLSDLPLLEAMLAHRTRFEAMWIKLPPSFDPSSVPGARPEAWFGAGSGDHRRVKFLLLVLD